MNNHDQINDEIIPTRGSPARALVLPSPLNIILCPNDINNRTQTVE